MVIINTQFLHSVPRVVTRITNTQKNQYQKDQKCVTMVFRKCFETNHSKHTKKNTVIFQQIKKMTKGIFKATDLMSS